MSDKVMKKRTKIFLTVLAVFLLIVVIMGSIFCIRLIESRKKFKEEVSFTIEKWQNVPENLKLYTAEDFLEKYEVVGMQRDEIISYLGESDELLGYETPKGKYLSYYCGCPKYSIDPYALVFELEDGVVVKAFIHES